MELMAQQLERIDSLIESFLLSPYTTETDAALQEALVVGNKDANDGEDDDTPVAVVPWDKADSSDVEFFCSQNNGSSSAPTSSSSSSLSSPKELDAFEGLVWEVELSDKVVRWFRRRAKRSSELCELVVQRLRVLASGRWSFPTNQKLLKGVPKGIHLYEAKIDAAKRILWEVAVTFSERRSANLAQEGQSAVFAEGIRVWAIVEDHDNISTEVNVPELGFAPWLGLESRIGYGLGYGLRCFFVSWEPSILSVLCIFRSTINCCFGIRFETGGKSSVSTSSRPRLFLEDFSSLKYRSAEGCSHT